MQKSDERFEFAPRGWPVVVPRIVAMDAKHLVRFIKRIFDAEGDYQQDVPTIQRIGGSVLMVSESDLREPATAFLYVYVPNVDATYRKAMRAGARSLEEPAELPYGDRRAMFEDQWGNTWQVATHRRVTTRKSSAMASKPAKRRKKS
jgi:PhnB protein